MTLAQIESLRSLESDWLASPDATKESRRREYQSALLASAGELLALAEMALQPELATCRTCGDQYDRATGRECSCEDG